MILVISGKGNKLLETKSKVKRQFLRPWHRWQDHIRLEEMLVSVWIGQEFSAVAGFCE